MITYCSNIHPGESWAEIFNNLQQYVPQVKAQVSPGDPFPIGLRLSERAVTEIDLQASERLLHWCQEQNCFIATINAFPFGRFHGSVVKEKVYLPDWRSRERVEYSQKVGRLLSLWLPEGLPGAISTVPIGFKPQLTDSDLPLIRNNLLQVLESYDQLRQQSGREICLALEPEPGCYLETTEDVCRFFARLKLPENLQSCLGICFDCCHQAVEFETPEQVIKQLSQAGIPIAKVQVSSAPRFLNPQPDELIPYIDDCYLHQVVVRDQQLKLHRFNDLPAALDALSPGQADEWRVHYHIPIFLAETESFQTTRSFIEALLPLLNGTELLEIETYTWEVLPAALRLPNVVDSIVREIQWLQEQQHAENRCS